MAKNTLISLARGLEMESGVEYKQYIVDSFINGNISQTRELFNDMMEEDRKDFLKELMKDCYFCSQEIKEELFDLLF